jgi:acetyltransferase-like isoleucine patch superfamily enzyme
MVPLVRRPFAEVIADAAVHPGDALSATMALLRGYWYRVKYRVRGIRFRTGRRLFVYGRLDVRGPGEVIFGDDVCVMERARPYTFTPEATIRVGNGVVMGATQFGCREEIVIGDRCQLAQAYIMDSHLHNPHVSARHDESADLPTAPVHIGENVWIAHFAGILPGTTIGKNSIVSFGSVCGGRVYPENVVLVGNPARVSATVRGTTERTALSDNDSPRVATLNLTRGEA